MRRPVHRTNAARSVSNRQTFLHGTDQRRGGCCVLWYFYCRLRFGARALGRGHLGLGGSAGRGQGM